jgi:DNA processing protein
VNTAIQDATGDAARPEVVAACALSAVPAVGAKALKRIASHFGSLRAALERGPAGLIAAAGTLRLAAEARAYLADGPDLPRLGRWALQTARDAGARVILLGDSGYPPALRDLESPPPLLYVRGELVPRRLRAAVVGARNADEAGLELARSFGDAFARAGVEVVSGGARGIDTAAHEGALWGEGTSIAVLGCGIDVPYPVENRELFDRLASGGGAVISEFAPGTPPAPRNFPRRNRIVAALADAVVVVRAALRSGALITLDHAAVLKRALFAVPGDPRDPIAAGPNALLRDDRVRPAPSPADVLSRMGWPIPPGLERIEPPSDASHQAGQAPSQLEGPDREVLDERCLRVWRLLDERTPAHVDDLALRSEMAPSLLLGKLLQLELKGLVVQRPGKYFLRR